MLTSNTMRFCTDMFGFVTDDSSDDTTDSDSATSSGTFVKKALLVSKTALDCSNKVAVQKIIISGNQETGTDRRFMFQIDGDNYKFNNLTLTKYTGDLTVDNVLKNGNTAAQLETLSDIPGFVDKKIYPIIALKTTGENLPTAKLQIKAQVANDKLTDTKESIAYDLVDDDSTPTITNISEDVSLTGDASVDIKISLRNGETWSSYTTLEKAVDKEAQGVKFQITYKVTKTDGTDSAKVNSITIEHSLGKAVVSTGTADLCSVVADYENDLAMCYCVVKHAPLNDSYIEAYVNFMAPPKERTLINLGTGNGSRKEFTLGLSGTADTNIDASSIELYEDTTQINDFSYNSETSTVTLVTVKNAVYTASYKYNHGVENWRQMTLEEREPLNDGSGNVTSRFTYALTDNEGMSTSNVMIRLKRPTGSVKNYSLGKATGKTQLFVLPHIPKMSTIKFVNDIGDNWDYDEDSNILSLIAAKNTELVINYSWVGENVIVYSLVTGWACA